MRKDHIPRVDIEALSDDQLDDQISRMSNASDSLPHKRALREERLSRKIASLGLSAAEKALGIGQVSYAYVESAEEYPENNVYIGVS
jgi:hypothetical protein